MFGLFLEIRSKGFGQLFIKRRVWGGFESRRGVFFKRRGFGYPLVFLLRELWLRGEFQGSVLEDFRLLKRIWIVLVLVLVRLVGFTLFCCNIFQNFALEVFILFDLDLKRKRDT